MVEPDYFVVRRYRKEAPQKFFGYPLICDRDMWICRNLVQSSNRILEIGSGDRPFEAQLRANGFRGLVRTMDVDRSMLFDYYSVDDVNETFDAVIMREVIEHLPRPVLYSYLRKITEILIPGGMLVITTPNPWAPSWVLSDYTHISPWSPADLYGVLRWIGFRRVEIYRIIWPSKFLWLKRIYWAIHSRFYDFDFAGSYLALATKPRDRELAPDTPTTPIGDS
jgi:SAM-dependent methyltransferase